MKNNILSTFIIGVTLLLAGCSSDIPCEPEIAGSGDSVLSIDIDMEESSRAPITSTSFREGDEVFVIVSDTYHPDPLTVTTKATYNGVTWELADKINLAGDISGVEWTHARVEVYYPYNMAANGYNSETRKIEIPNIMTSQNDILYGVGGANKETSNVTVHCRHALTCLTLALKNNSSENATFDTISVRNKGIQGFLGYKGTLDYDGIHVSGYTEWMKTIYGGKIIIPAGETFNLNYLLPPTMAAYDNMMDYVSHGMPKTILEFELNLNGNATYFSIDAAVWRDGCQYTYPVNLFKSSEPEPVENEYVDLGLPSGTKWCTHNVGATYPWEYGGYYAWGETEEKSVYNLDSYKFWGNSTGFLNIGTEISGTEYDVAHVLMGDTWCMPTFEQVKELCDICTWEWTARNGVNGNLVTGPNGSQIFLPAAGYFSIEKVIVPGSMGFYWTGSRTPNRVDMAYNLNFVYGNLFHGHDYDEVVILGFSVRPVCQ